MKVRDDRSALFIDSSADPVRRIGVGAFLVAPASLVEPFSPIHERREIIHHPVLRRFEGTSSTTLEVQTVLWALEEYRITSADSGQGKLRIYSDSQCIAGLLKRRPELAAKGFRSRGTDRRIRNAALYCRFYELHDELAFEVTKVKGHSCRNSRDAVQKVFSCLDRQARKELRTWVQELEADRKAET